MMSSDPSKPQRPCVGQFSNIQSKWLSRLLPEVILRILSWLDAGSLLCISLVNRHFNELTNSNTCSAMWYQFYVHERNKKKIANPKNKKIVVPSTVSPQEIPKGYWRKMFFREMSGLIGNKWKKKLHRIDPYSGMPCYTEEVVRSLCVSWEITVTDGRGRRSTFKQSHAAFSSTAVFLYWGASNWPPFNQLTSLELHGVLRVPLDCPAAYRPGWKSCMSKIPLQGENKELCASDKLVKLLCIGQGVTLGFWQDCCMMNLTLWDEAEQPFWCVTAPVVIADAEEDEDSALLKVGGINITHRINKSSS
ncbi:F-box only protein 15 [Triplophysa tibetana]|uniref:F-box only protein 15 n=1 Tax=Triplophysa tibetana TaxID=1572043 RepID=A0A5A9N667_9TELE|nr:F-box only protein 15 [Triplophysa tibetana]